jgi:hypothetical protein
VPRVSDNPEYVVELQCLTCGKTFRSNTWEKRKLCGPACLPDYLSKRNKGMPGTLKQAMGHKERMDREARHHVSRRRADPEVRATAIREWILEMRHAARVEAGQ